MCLSKERNYQQLQIFVLLSLGQTTHVDVMDINCIFWSLAFSFHDYIFSNLHLLDHVAECNIKHERKIYVVDHTCRAWKYVTNPINFSYPPDLTQKLIGFVVPNLISSTHLTLLIPSRTLFYQGLVGLETHRVGSFCQNIMQLKTFYVK